ncbi:hypothetical protein NL676_019148 [Syzygium grande]|nr:hypothetical protein NL676_019148 [Syzygium grande]
MAAEEEQQTKKGKTKGKHDKPKPWDEDPSIDRWRIEKFDPSWNEGGMLEVSSFSTLFPQYREKYLQEAWPLVKVADSVCFKCCMLVFSPRCCRKGLCISAVCVAAP